MLCGNRALRILQTKREENDRAIVNYHDALMKAARDRRAGPLRSLGILIA